MSYLLSQIWLCLGLTALIAGLAGWFLRGSSKAKMKAMTEEWKVKLARAQNERDYYAGEVKSLTAMAEERENIEKNYQSEKQALSIQLEDMRVDAEKTSEAFNDQEYVLKKQASELEASNRALLASSDKQQKFQQKLMDSETNAERISVALRTAEEKISDLQTELDSTKIQLLDTTDKLSITEDLLAERQHLTAQEGQTILVVKDQEDNPNPSPSPAPIQTTKHDSQNNTILGVGRLLSTPTSSVEIVDAHDKMPDDFVEEKYVEPRPIDARNVSTKTTTSEPKSEPPAFQHTPDTFVDDITAENKNKTRHTTKTETETKTTEQALDDAFADDMTVVSPTVKDTISVSDNNSYPNNVDPKHDNSYSIHNKHGDGNNNYDNNGHLKKDDIKDDIKHDVNAENTAAHKSATLAGAGAAALGMAGKMKEKLTQAKDDLMDKVDFTSEVYAIQEIHTINNESAQYLSRMNVLSTEDLIDKCTSKEGVELIAKSMGKESWVVRSWASMADLMRVKGIDGVNAELLELSGISSVQALASAKIQRLTDSIKVIHKHVGKTNHVPDYEEIEGWIKSAVELPKRLDDHLDKL